MFSAPLLKILVTVLVVGQPPITELLPQEYPTMRSAECEQDAADVLSRAREGVTVHAECVEAEARGS